MKRERRRRVSVVPQFKRGHACYVQDRARDLQFALLGHSGQRGRNAERGGNGTAVQCYSGADADSADDRFLSIESVALRADALKLGISV